MVRVCCTPAQAEEAAEGWWGSLHPCPFLLVLLHCRMGCAYSWHQSRDNNAEGFVGLCWHQPWVCPDSHGYSVSLGCPQAAVTLGRRGSKQTGRAAEPPGSPERSMQVEGIPYCVSREATRHTLRNGQC